VTSAARKVLTHRVRYHETDAQGFLFNSRYLELADVAMTEYFRALGFSYEELNAAGADPAVVSARLEFKQPARFDDVLDVGVAATRVGRSSFDLSTVILRGGEPIAEMVLTYVNVDACQAVSRPLPDIVARALLVNVTGHADDALEIHQ
jgi:acyl-CoA thioester hydrolase